MRCHYKHYRYPIAIISHAVWCYYRFSLSFRDVEELLACRGIYVTYESIRQWSTKWGTTYANRLKKRKMQTGSRWHIDEMCITIRGEKHWLFRAVDEQGYELDIMVQPKRDKKSVIRFFKKLLKGSHYIPKIVVTDKLSSYKEPIASLLPNSLHRSHKRLNNRVENSHQPTRRREKQLIQFKSPLHANNFSFIHGQVGNLFATGRYKNPASLRKTNLTKALATWHKIAS